MSNNRNANLMKEMEQELSHILKCLELYIPIHLKFNVDTRRIEYMKYRSAASLILMALSNLAMVYYTYFDTFLDNETKFAMKFLQYNFASVFLAKIWFLLFVAVHYKTDTIRLWNDLLTLNDRHRSLRLVCRTFKRTVLLILLIPTSWNLLYDLANLHNAIRFEGNPERCYAFVLIVTDFISTVTCLVHITLLTMFASYFKQLCEKLDAIVREDYGEVFELTLKEIMRSFECFYDMVLRTVKLTSPLLLAMLSHSMLIITRSLCEICTKIFIGKGYMHFEIATELYVAFGAFVFSGMLIVPCELCMNYVSWYVNMHLWNLGYLGNVFFGFNISFAGKQHSKQFVADFQQF